MKLPDYLRNRPVLAVTTGHWLSQSGLGTLITGIVTWIILIPMRLQHGEENPYIGLAMFVAVPIVLFVGTVLIVLGLWLGRGKIRERLAENIDNRNVALRRLLAFGAVTAAVNLVVGTQVTYRAVEHMESREFCGSCHVMTPEATAIDPGPHSGLLCVDCHVGSGVKGWVESKRGGTRQLMEVLMNRVPKPIPSAIESGRMVASSETCERCHDRSRLGAIRLKVFRRYDEDEANTPDDTVLTMHVGGSKMGGIHGAHHGPGVEIRFVAADPNRQDIPLVEYENSETGETRTYVRSDADAAAYADAPRIAMQCIDCHNRAAHSFMPPDRAIDLALTLGLMSSSLPYLKSQGMKILTATYETSAEAATQIPKALSDYYSKDYPELNSSRAEDVAEAGQALAQLYGRNVFPELDVTWNTYVDNRGHTDDAPGCFRCHEGEHSTSSGEEISGNCFLCHTASSVEETDPEILRSLGLKKPIDAMLKK